MSAKAITQGTLGNFEHIWLSHTDDGLCVAGRGEAVCGWVGYWK